METIFSGAAALEFQGEIVLTLLQSFDDHVEYSVVSFMTKPIRVLDYRQAGLAAIRYVHDTSDTSRFADDFNVPAHVTIKRNHDHRSLPSPGSSP